MAVTHQQLFSEANKKQAMADMLQGRAMQQRGPQQLGPVASKMHWGEGLAQLGEALLARRAGKQADEKFNQADEAKRQAMADAMSGMGGNAQQIQGALDAGVDPAAISAHMQSQQPEKLTWKDAGDAWVGLNGRGEEVQRVPKGASPDASLGANVTMRGQDIGAETTRAGHGVAMRGQDIGAQTAMRGQDVGAQNAQLSADVTMRGQDISAETARQAQEFKAALAAETGGAKVDEKAQESVTAWNTYQTARDHLMSSLDATSTGPVAGRMPAFTAAQQTADAAYSAMAPVLKQLFRQAGEGIFTDKDQELLLGMIADRTLAPEARLAAMQNVDQIVMAKLGLSGAPQQDTQDDPELEMLLSKYGSGGGY